MLNDEELAKKGFHAIEDFISFKQVSFKLVKDVFSAGASGLQYKILKESGPKSNKFTSLDV